MSIPISQFIRPCFLPLVTIRLFSTPMTLYLFSFFSMFARGFLGWQEVLFSTLCELKMLPAGNSLVVQWLGLGAFTAGGPGFNPCSGN